VTASTQGDRSPHERAELVARLAHEIRGPVSTLRGLAGTTLAHYDGLDDAERREFLELIRHEADRLERVVEEVALALKLDAGAMSFERRTADVASVVKTVAEAADVGTHPLELDADDEVKARIDASRLSVAVRELIDNAAAYSPPGASIVVRVRREGDDAVIEVVDRGPGIPAGEHEAVFERFARWRPAGYEDRPGAGLGLFITRAIARGHGGDASIVTAPTGGTMLTVRFPAEGWKAGDG
jgi:signal transduction histidine kinase